MTSPTKGHFSQDPALQYCIERSGKLHPAQHKLIEATMNHPEKIMLGATEVLQTCICLIKQLKCKHILDVGTYTGYSALSFALAIPNDGKVFTMDIVDDYYNNYGKRFVDEAGVAHKIDFRVQPVLKTMDDLISAGWSGKCDFAFLDADKKEYPQYYEKCMQLLRPGGFIAVDNALWFGKVFDPANNDHETRAIRAVNELISNDSRVNSMMLKIGDGLHLAFKK